MLLYVLSAKKLSFHERLVSFLLYFKLELRESDVSPDGQLLKK